MDLMTVTEAAELWGLTKRRVQAMCEMGQIKNAQRLGNMWVFPKSTERPMDGRTKAAKQAKNKRSKNGEYI
jgi:excisionase family DNA binding protein